MTRNGYGQAYEKGLDLTIRFLRSRGVQRDSACEVAQAAWVRGWEQIGQLRDESLLHSWVNTIALNFYRTLIRRGPVSQLRLEPQYRTTRIDLAAIDLAKVLAHCRPAHRRLLEQRMRGATAAEIASEHGVSATAIRIRLWRALREARSYLERGAPARHRSGDVSLPSSVGGAGSTQEEAT